MIVRGAIAPTAKSETEELLMNNGCLCNFLGDNWVWLLIIALLILCCGCN